MLKRTVGGIDHDPAAAVGPEPDDTHHPPPPHSTSHCPLLALVACLGQGITQVLIPEEFETLLRP